ncbi:glucose-6-phosphate-specific signal transduction histidine kinase [Rhizobium cellulosilyticum]|uniref:Glucose-6-phosphate-specific signal transduction histidine kinase n=1 Tax=Aliirhizobium cellulosilyticum TaxID=393664 RepID=A0A7W6UZ30_9HYPH|nr:glucose-6-phosphate-specific signal transduction histidine kinase [Rhizobium cellulosilyticum]
MIINLRAKTALFFVVPLSMTAVFLLDILGPFDPFISILYLPVIVLSTRAFSNTGVFYSGLVAMVMTSASFVLSQVEGFDGMTSRQFALIAIAIAATTVLTAGLAPRRPHRTDLRTPLQL